MTISVIIPFYYGNQYIDNLLCMLRRNQSELSKEKIGLEVVIINDSPSENVVIEEDLEEISILIFNNKQNLGIHKSRVNGLEKCHGDYVLFLDQDDLISAQCLLSHVLRIGNADFSVSNGYLLEINDLKKPIYTGEKHQNCCLNLDFHYGFNNPIISPGQVLIKKEAIPMQWKDHIFKNNGADDHYLWLLLLEQKKRGVINTDFLYTHVSTGNNTSLNIQEMCASSREMITLLKGIAKRNRLHMLERRVLYYSSNPEKLLTKLRFIDVALTRMYFNRFIH